MNNMNIILSILILIFLDLIWVKNIMTKRYKILVNNIQKSPLKINYKMAICAYTLMVAGLLIFVLPNIRKNHEFIDSIKYGFSFGFITYGIYNFTAGSVFNDWDYKILIMDILWGGFVYFITAFGTSMIINYLYNLNK